MTREQLKIMEKEQLAFKAGLEYQREKQDEFAIGFAEWCLDENHIILNDGKELLEIYKKEKEL